MKKAFNIILFYLTTVLAGTAALATVFVISSGTRMYVTDVPSSLFSLDYFLLGAAYSFPFVGIAVLAGLVLMMIRKPENKLSSLITYVVLGGLTWLLLIPFSLSKLSDYDEMTHNLIRNTSSAGIFREDASGVIYYSRILEDGNADGIFIDTTGYLGQEGNVIDFYDQPVKNSGAYPYSDILIKRAVQPPAFVSYILQVYNSLMTAAVHFASSGFLSWLCFAALGLALLSVYGLQFLSEWRLCSAFFTLSSVTFIVLMNYFYYMDFMPSGIRDLGQIISEHVALENALIVVFDLIMAVLLTVLGIGLGIYRARKVQISVTGDE